LEQVRADAAIPRLERILVKNFIEELRSSATMQAEVLGLRLEVHSLGPDVAIDGDRPLLAAAMSNLLQNAFKFTPSGTVVLTARATEERVFLEVADECGGLPPGKAAELFRPFTQRSEDRSGLGLGLAIALRSARACGGELRVRDLPEHGCVFTIELPRRPAPSNALQPLDGF
jgi:signal transduction histidine kinase